MPERLSRQEAIEFLGIPGGTFNNFFQTALEFPALERVGRGRFYFSPEVLRRWKEAYEWRTVLLDQDDYVRCLDFALAQHFRGYVLANWGLATQREFGQKMTNWIKGQLGEVAVQKFLQEKFNFEVELDFEIRDSIVAQDITGVKEGNRTRAPRTGVGIKSSKPKSAYLILSENEVALENRRSSLYVFCRPNIPDDHLLRVTSERIRELVREQTYYPSYQARIEPFAPILCEVAGWIRVQDLEHLPVSEIEGLESATGFRYVKKSGQLNRSEESWRDFIRML